MQASTARSRARPSSWVAAALAGVCILAPLRARATEGQDFELARDAYVAGEYERAVQLFESMVGGETPAIRDDVLIRESRKYLAAAYVLTGQRDLGARQFEFLLRAEGDRVDGYRLDRAAFPREVLQVFDGVRNELLRQRDARRAAERRISQAQDEQRREATLRLLDLAQHDEVEIVHDRLLAWIPFGVGQFQNGDSGLGAFFLAAESVALAGALASTAAWIPLDQQDQHLGPTSTVDVGLMRGLQIADWASVGAFAALALAGVIEAHINFVPSHRIRRDREVPADVLEGLDLSLGPTGFGLRLRF
jgi:hypothetical protein